MTISFRCLRPISRSSNGTWGRDGARTFDARSSSLRRACSMNEGLLRINDNRTGKCLPRTQSEPERALNFAPFQGEVTWVSEYPGTVTCMDFQLLLNQDPQPEAVHPAGYTCASESTSSHAGSRPVALAPPSLYMDWLLSIPGPERSRGPENGAPQLQPVRSHY